MSNIETNTESEIVRERDFECPYPATKTVEQRLTRSVLYIISLYKYYTDTFVIYKTEKRI